MEEWKRLLRESITAAEDLARYIDVDQDDIRDTVRRYPMRINPYFLGLIREKGDSIGLQVIPDREEIEDRVCVFDPLNEEGDSPVPNIVHRYPDRVLFLVATQCPVYCRFCTRKRKVGTPEFVTSTTIQTGIDYIKGNSGIRDVILSGGDPLLLVDKELERILEALRRIPHVEIIRIGTRVPSALPQRITRGLCNIIKRYHPVYINIHFNHPDEITEESKSACEMLSDAGIPLGSQTVLLKGVNDDPDIIKRLMQQLLAIRVRPYYIYQADLTLGTNHFRTDVGTGIRIMKNLMGFTSGLAVPHYVIDAPGGGGKIAILPDDNLVYMDNKIVIMKNYTDKTYSYPQTIDMNEPCMHNVGRQREEIRVQGSGGSG